MALCDRDLVTRLLKQSILTLCREAVAYKNRLEVDGIICLTADDQEQHVVKIHEIFDRQKESETGRLPVRSPPIGSAYTARSASDEQILDRSAIRNAANELAEKDASIRTITEIEKVVIKTEPNTDTDTNTDVVQGEEPMQRDYLHETKSNVQTSSDNSTSINYAGLGLNELTISSARNIPCKKCNSVLENVELFQVHNMTSHNHFTCLVCLSTFTSRNNMKRHIRLHTGIKPYSCHKCTESFSRNDDYKRHLLKHTFQKPFRCAVCKTGYSDRSCVKNHMIKEHNAKIFHVCPQCGESYVDLIKFQQHKKCHPELQDYRCSICSFSGSSALMYNKHMLTHGPLKEYKCTHCDLTYSDPFMYTNHLKRHKGDELVQSYSCCFCEMSLPSFEQFQRHEHTHVHSKQHICEVCSKVFRYPSNLREHMLTHLPKSAFQGKKNTVGRFEYSDRLNQITRGTENPLPTVLEDVNDHHLETTEENNNKIDDDIANNGDIEKDENSSDKDDMSGCSDYWCTECSHGFGTENELQNHIIYKHERKDVEIKKENDESSSRTKNNGSSEMEDPFEISTQIDDPLKDVYNEHTQPVLPREHSEHNQTTHSLTKGQGHQSYSENPKCKSEPPSIYYPNPSLRVYNEVTVVDRPAADRNANSSVKKESDNKLDIVTNAMRQVKDIQSRFGIKTVEQDVLRTRDSREHKRRQAGVDFEIRKKSLLHHSGPDTGRSEQSDQQSDRHISVSLSGMKLKIHRASYTSADSPENTTHITYSSINDNEQQSTANEVGNQRGTVASDLISTYSRSSVLGMDTEFSSAPNRPSPFSTTLNLKVRNPGFERVVTPEVLFKTKAPFTCEVCEETFETFDNFHDHGVKIHRRFICSYCGKIFTSRPNRERHIRYHTGEKPYKCELCSATFLRGDDLKYHRTTKHADIKPFTCGACQTSFALPKDLEKHLKIYPDHKL